VLLMVDDGYYSLKYSEDNSTINFSYSTKFSTARTHSSITARLRRPVNSRRQCRAYHPVGCHSSRLPTRLNMRRQRTVDCDEPRIQRGPQCLRVLSIVAYTESSYFSWTKCNINRMVVSLKPRGGNEAIRWFEDPIKTANYRV
jgi:hypothetical protein